MTTPEKIIDPTKTESKNGWGEKELAAYVAQRNMAASDKILHWTKSQGLKVENARGYNPHNWQKGGR